MDTRAYVLQTVQFPGEGIAHMVARVEIVDEGAECADPLLAAMLRDAPRLLGSPEPRDPVIWQATTTVCGRTPPWQAYGRPEDDCQACMDEDVDPFAGCPDQAI